MIRELRRFNLRDEAGDHYTVCEITAYLVVDGAEVMDGIPTLITLCGREVLPNGKGGEYHIPRLGRTARVVE